MTAIPGDVPSLLDRPAPDPAGLRGAGRGGQRSQRFADELSQAASPEKRSAADRDRASGPEAAPEERPAPSPPGAAAEDYRQPAAEGRVRGERAADGPPAGKSDDETPASGNATSDTQQERGGEGEPDANANADATQPFDPTQAATLLVLAEAPAEVATVITTEATADAGASPIGGGAAVAPSAATTTGGGDAASIAQPADRFVAGAAGGDAPGSSFSDAIPVDAEHPSEAPAGRQTARLPESPAARPGVADGAVAAAPDEAVAPAGGIRARREGDGGGQPRSDARTAGEADASNGAAARQGQVAIPAEPAAPADTPDGGPAAVEPAPANAERATPPSTRTEPTPPTLPDIAAGRLTGAGAEKAGGQDPAPAIDPARFVSRVSRAVQAASERGGELRLRLNPPELGAVQIKLSLGEGAIRATLETETPAARNLLLENLPALRDRLAEQEVRIDKFDVDVREEGGEQQRWESRDRDRQRRADTQRGDRRPAETTAENATPAPAVGAASSGGDGLDVTA